MKTPTFLNKLWNHVTSVNRFHTVLWWLFVDNYIAPPQPLISFCFCLDQDITRIFTFLGIMFVRMVWAHLPQFSLLESSQFGVYSLAIVLNGSEFLVKGGVVFFNLFNEDWHSSWHFQMTAFILFFEFLGCRWFLITPWFIQVHASVIPYGEYKCMVQFVFITEQLWISQGNYAEHSDLLESC